MCIFSLHVPAFLHVENVTRVNQTIEVEEPKAEYQGEQEKFMEADPAEEQFPETDFANSSPQQGKHWFMINPESYY